MIDKNIIKWIKVYVIGSLVLFAIIGCSVVFFVISKAFQSQKLINSQIEYQNALTENVGKPQIIEQRYFSPNK